MIKKIIFGFAIAAFVVVIESFITEYQNPTGETGGAVHWYTFSQAVEMAKKDAPPNIVQIKGKQNKAPKAEYLPYVQDFVKSGQWADVGDIQNTGLRNTSDAFNENELKKIQEAGLVVPKYATKEEIKK